RPTNSGLMGLRITEYQTTTRKGAMKNTVTPSTLGPRKPMLRSRSSTRSLLRSHSRRAGAGGFGAPDRRILFFRGAAGADTAPARSPRGLKILIDVKGHAALDLPGGVLGGLVAVEEALSLTVYNVVDLLVVAVDGVDGVVEGHELVVLLLAGGVDVHHDVAHAVAHGGDLNGLSVLVQHRVSVLVQLVLRRHGLLL